MADVLCVGTVGEGIWRSVDGGQTFTRRSPGLFMEADVRALCVHPELRHVVYAGTNGGAFCSTDGGETWTRLELPFDTNQGWAGGTIVWSLAIMPGEPEALFVGTCPAAIYCSRDSGDTWRKVDAPVAAECGGIVYPRVTCLAPDPIEPDTLWAGVEIDGILRSRDRGETWERLGEGLSSQDIHGIVIVPGAPKRILATTNNDLNVSLDDGLHWQPQNVRERFPWGYCRGITAGGDDPQTLFLGNGNGPPGSEGTLQISRDGGVTWHAATLPSAPNSTVWTIATSPTQPQHVAAATVSGYLYISDDGGESWSKLEREFGEIRSLAFAATG